MRWASFFMGVLILTGLDAVLSSDASASRAGGALSLVSSAVTHLMSPASPLIPDLRTSAAATSTSTSSTVVATPAIVQLAPTSAAAAAAVTKSA
jgi:hypothetical protein